MQEIIDIIQPLRGTEAAANAKARLKDLGYLFGPLLCGGSTACTPEAIEAIMAPG